MEEQHLQEFNEFNEKWDKKMEEFIIHAEQLARATKERQQEEKEESERMLDKALALHPKPSVELLNLRKIMEHLSKQKRSVCIIFNSKDGLSSIT